MVDGGTSLFLCIGVQLVLNLRGGHVVVVVVAKHERARLGRRDVCETVYLKQPPFLSTLRDSKALCW